MRSNLIGALGAALIAIGATDARSDDFYRGKNIQLIIATGPGAAYDFFGRLVSRHIGRFIPGEPVVTPQNMPGASGFRAANYLFNVAPKDGTVLGTFNNAIAFYQVVEQPGIQSRAEEFSWLGAIPQDTPQVAVHISAGVKTIEDAKKIEVAMGATGAGGNFAGHVALLNSLLGTRFKIVTGYDSGATINMAIERGEVSGKANTTWPAYKSLASDWVREGKIIPLVQFGLKKDPDLPSVPLLMELASNEEQRRIFEVVASTSAVGQPFAAPPQTPADRLEILRKAFASTVVDAAFRAEAAKVSDQTSMEPISSSELTALVQRTVATPPALAARLRQAMSVKREN
ncbi:MAG: hypothetical protein Q8M31_19035 [Beijerinckiaceae bacterium]|nr:hypothetical protein [Beijerinckiaceae bacterium]